MSEEIKIELKSKHHLCANWYILTELWKNTYREVWTKRETDKYRERWESIPGEKKTGKFILDSKVPVLIDNGGNKEYALRNFYDLFAISHSDYNKIMHSNYPTMCYPAIMAYEETKIRNYSKVTGLPSYIFNGKECLIPLTDENRVKIFAFANARFDSQNKYEYREEANKIKLLTKKYAYLSDMITAISFVDRELDVTKIDPIVQSMENILALHYNDLVKTELPILKRYIEVLKQHTERAKACYIHRINIR